MRFQAFTLRMLLACVFIVGFASGVQAQERKNADRIIAIVGRNRIILQSELDMQSQQMAAQQFNGVPLTDSMRCLLLQELITTKMLVEQAERDSLLVSDEEVDGNLDNRIRYFVSMYGSREKLEQAQGKTIHQLKEDNRDIVREQMMAEKVRTKLLENVRVTPGEVQAFFNKQNKDSLPYYPATIEVGEIVIDPSTSAELDKYAKDKLEDIRKQIVTDGKAFETMAGLYSEDPGSRDNGGLMTDVSRNGGFVTEFISAAFRLQNGEISPVIRTQFGYHIIQMVKRKGEQVDVRHILIMPQHTSEDYKTALLKLDSVRALIIAGTMNFTEAVAKFSTDQNAKMTGGMIIDQRSGSSQLAVDQLDPQIALMIDSLKPGSISQPQQYKNARGELSTRLVYLRARTDPHQANLKDDYSKIQSIARAQKEYDKLESWIAERLPTYYLKVDPAYQNCANLQHWYKVTSQQ